jgi:hypothetical protein
LATPSKRPLKIPTSVVELHLSICAPREGRECAAPLRRLVVAPPSCASESRGRRGGLCLRPCRSPPRRCAIAAASVSRPARAREKRDVDWGNFSRARPRVLFPLWNGGYSRGLDRAGIPTGRNRTRKFCWAGSNPGRADPRVLEGIGPQSRPGWN